LAENSLFPAFFQLRVVSEFGTHFHNIPTREYDVNANEFLNWNDVPVSATDMIEDYVDLLLPFHVASTEVVVAIIYTLENETAPPEPRTFITLTGKVGTNTASVVPASEGIYTFRSTNFGLHKIVFLDAPVTSDFLPFDFLSSSAALANLFNLISDEDNAFAARDGGRPAQFVRASFGLNKALQKKYNRL
jgi:hypothetical protein